jgi:peroxiredoxin
MARILILVNRVWYFTVALGVTRGLFHFDLIPVGMGSTVPLPSSRPARGSTFKENPVLNLPTLSLALVAFLAATPALAALKPGDQAPDFQAKASMAGQVSSFSLAAALKRGPVVLYFYPAAFTPGCTTEAHDFAEAVEQYAGLGATVIGVSHDEIDKLNQFSVSECRGKFAVLADPDQHIIKAYDVVWEAKPQLASRTSYVITPDRKILYAYTDLKPDQHVANTLAALKEWRAKAVK